jgi:hypothetical protein
MPVPPLDRYIMAKLEETPAGELVVHLAFPQDQLKADPRLVKLLTLVQSEGIDISVAPAITGPGQPLEQISCADDPWYQPE